MYKNSPGMLMEEAFRSAFQGVLDDKGVSFLHVRASFVELCLIFTKVS